MQREDETVRSIFVPDIITPDQYHDARRASAPDPLKRLMLAVLQDAIHCFQGGAQSSRKSAQRCHEEAKAWLFDESPEVPFSFESICDALGIAPHYLRFGLIQWYELHLNGQSKPQRVGRHDPVVPVRQIKIRANRPSVVQ